MSYNIYTITQDKAKNYDFSEFTLWYSDFEESGINECYVAFSNDNDNIVGFLTVNGDNKCVAIEVLESYQGNGIAFDLLKEAQCYAPEQDDNPEFWAKVAEVYT